METITEIEAIAAEARLRLGPEEYARRMAELRETWRADEIAAKIARARKLIDQRRATAIALADALEGIARLTSDLEQANADLAKLDLTPEQRNSLSGRLTKLPADVRVVLNSNLPEEVRQVDTGKLRASIESVHAALVAAIEGKKAQ